MRRCVMSARRIDKRPIARAPTAPAPTARAPGAPPPAARLSAMALQLRLELLERSGVAFFHSRLEQWRRELEDTAGLGLHHQPYVCARAVVAQLPVAGRSHRSRSRLHARATPGELVVRLELRPLEGPFHAAA